MAAWYHLLVPVSRIRQYAGTDQEGTTLYGLQKAAEQMGFEAKAGKGNAESLDVIPLPAVAHLLVKNRLLHYIVIVRTARKHVHVMDPAEGRMKKMRREIFSREWTGALLLLSPADSFVRSGARVSTWERFVQLALPQRKLLVQSLAGAVLYTGLGMATSVYVQKVVDLAIADGNTSLLRLLSLTMLVLLTMQALIGGFRNWLTLKAGVEIDTKLILGYYRHLLRLPQRFFDTMRVGEIISRVNDAARIRAFVNETAIQIVVDVMIILFATALMFVYNLKLAMLACAILPVYMLIHAISRLQHKKWQRILMEKSAALENRLVESVGAAQTVKRLGLQQREDAQTTTVFLSLMNSVFDTGTRSVLIGACSEMCTHALITAVIWCGSLLVLRNELTLGELLSFYALASCITGPAGSLIAANRNIQDAMIAADRLFEIVDLETEDIIEGGHPVNRLQTDNRDIVFENIHFTHGTRGTVFEGLNMKIPQGAFVGIAGESGCGKSTLQSLIQHLYNTEEGRISIGEVDIKYIAPKLLRKIVGVVPQHTDLFACTILENITIGDPEPDAERAMRIAASLGIDGFVEKLPAGYYTLLGQQGMTLSGGQRQKLAVARALYHDPDILVLDEATSALDAANQQRVRDALMQWKTPARTIVMIAHRISAIQGCDVILVLKDGKLAEQGTHAELMSLSGEYRRLCTMENGGITTGAV